MNSDVAVVGGGVAGLGVAWRAAQRGLDVVVVDPAPGAAASHVAAGMLAPVTEVAYGEEAALGLHVESARRWPDFAAELEAASGMPIGYRAEGTLVVAGDADDHRALLEVVAFQRELGLDVEVLRSSECRSREPALAPGLRGGAFVPGDRQVDNRRVVAALLAAADAAGVRFVSAPVDGVNVVGGRVAALRLGGGGDVVTPVVVNAAGAWASHLPGIPAEARPPVRPVKGQILRFRGTPADPVLRHTVRAAVRGSSVYLVPREDGEVVVGGTVEERGFDTTVTVEAVHDLVRDAIDVVPGLVDLEFVEARAGLRPGTPDNAPVLGPSVVDGLVMATGHYRHGFLLLPVTADAVAEYLATGAVPDVIAPFAPDRFVGSGATAG